VFNSPEVKQFIEEKIPAFIPAGFSSKESAVRWETAP
jgi:D-methionine transport system substrate-binding protein